MSDINTKDREPSFIPPREDKAHDQPDKEDAEGNHNAIKAKDKHCH
jgi:hypothetical protein